MKSTSHLNRSRLFPLLFALAMVASESAAQQDPSYFFHQGARHFLATNEQAQAKSAVTNGLRMFPDDTKLKKLWELLNQQQQQQQNQDDKKDKDEKKDQSKQDQPESKEQKQDDQKKQDQKPEDQQQKQQQEQSSKQDKEKGDEKKGQQPSPQQDKGDPQEEGEAQPQGGKAVRMTPQQAIQLLEALKGEEKVMPFRPVLKTNRQDRIFKDW